MRIGTKNKNTEQSINRIALDSSNKLGAYNFISLGTERTFVYLGGTTDIR